MCIDLSSRYSSRKQVVVQSRPVMRYLYPSYSEEVDKHGDIRTVIKIDVHTNDKPLIKAYDASDFKISALLGAGKLKPSDLVGPVESMQSLTGGVSRLSAAITGDEIARMVDPTPVPDSTFTPVIDPGLTSVPDPGSTSVPDPSSIVESNT